MRPIIMDMKDMSDSTEVYESRPNPVLAGFIYVILAMLATALVWMVFCKMDIVVKGTGTVVAAEDVATVTNQVAGIITGRMIEDGQMVKKGDVLYTVSHEEQSLQLEALKAQLANLEEKEEMLKAYETWLKNGEEFSESLAGNIYYSEVTARKQLVELGEQATLQSYAGELSAYEAKIGANTAMKDYYRDAIVKSRQLMEAIKNRKNSFSGEDSYHWNYMENYLAQYAQASGQYDDKIKELQKQSDEAGKEIETLETKRTALQENRTGQEQNTVTVSGSDVMQDSVSHPDEQIQSLEAQITSKKAVKEAADSSISQYIAQKNSAMNAYEKECIAAIESSILGYEQNIAAYEGTQQEYLNGQNALKEQGTEVELGNLVTQEKHNVAGELDACRQSRTQLARQIESLNQVVENATVKASMNGKVNFAIDPVEGDYLAAGTQVLSIIPESDTGAFLIKNYVENKDIAKVQEGMQVTYEIGAYPSREYGVMGGEVTFVSADLKVNNSGSAYYVVETSVDAGEFRNRLGEEASLKVGMLCETKIVIEEKSVLEVLIEKLFH